MPQQIDVPGMGVVEFPDGMSDQQIVAAIQANAPAKAPAVDKLADSAKGAGIGLVKGALDTLATPAKPLEMAVEGLRGAGVAGAKAMGVPVPEFLSKPAPTYAGLMQSGIERVTGPFYEPKSTEGKVSEVAASLLPALAIPGGPGRAVAPTRDALALAAKGAYKAPEVAALELRPSSIQSATSKIDDALKDAGYRDYLAPKTFRAIKELEDIPSNQSAKVADFEGVRRALQKAAGDPAEKDAARRAINALEDHLENINPRDVVAGDLTAATETLAKGRGDYAATKRSERVAEALAKAERQAGRAGSGGNIDNAMRQKISSILDSPSKSRGFSPDERAQMDKVVSGTTIGNIARLIGKAAPTGIVSGGLSSGAGFLAGGPIGAVALPVAGAIAKRIGDRSTRRQIEKLDEMVRARSPSSTVSPQSAGQYDPQRLAAIAAILQGQAQR